MKEMEDFEIEKILIRRFDVLYMGIPENMKNI
jgi:hypothetical protein